MAIIESDFQFCKWQNDHNLFVSVQACDEDWLVENKYDLGQTLGIGSEIASMST